MIERVVALLEALLDFVAKVEAYLRVRNTELALVKKNETKNTTDIEHILHG